MRGIVDLTDIEAIEARGIPRDLPSSTYELLVRSARAYAEQPALSYFRDVTGHTTPRTWTYRALAGEVTRAANAFHALGATRDTVIALVLPNLPETHFATWGAQAAGIAVPINYLLAPDAIVDVLEATAASILVTLAPSSGMDWWTGLAPALTRVRSLRHVVLVDATESVARDSSSPGASFEVHDFADCLRQQPGDRLVSGRHIEPDDYSSFLCTGGTTGAPKVAMRRHRNEVCNAWSVAQSLGDAMGTGKNLFCGLPLFHANGLMVTGLMPWMTGAHVVLGTPLGYRGPGVIENFWSIVEHHRIHFFSAVPTIYGALLQVPRTGHSLASLEYGLCGAAPMPRELLERFERETGTKILEGYGLTEATCVSSLNPVRGERRSGSIGLRLPGQAMKPVIFDADGVYLRDARTGESGVIVIAGPNVFSGYLQAGQDRALWVDAGDGQRWLDTGDLGYCDADGYFWLVGRAKDLIIRGGHNIDPAAIEQPLYAHPAVHLAAAVGRPDAHAGELPVVYVQLRSGHDVAASELMSYLEKHIRERAAMPKAVMLAPIPLTAIGKINKPELRRRETEVALRHALEEKGIVASSVRVESGATARDASAIIALADTRSRAAAEAIAGRLGLNVRFAADR